jgi:hypothetical protein
MVPMNAIPTTTVHRIIDELNHPAIVVDVDDDMV